MKILQLCTKVPFPPKDGGAAGVYAFSAAFQSIGHTVDILAVNPPKHSVNDKLLTETANGIRIFAIPVNTTPNFFKAFTNLLFSSLPYQVERFIATNYQQKLVELLTNLNPDIVQLEGIFLSPYIPIIRKHSKAKIILRSPNIEHLLWNDITKQEKNWIKKLYFHIQAKRIKRYELECISKVDGVIAFTNLDLNYLKSQKPGIKMKLIPFGLHEKPNNSLIKTREKSIFYIGALDWIPNQKAIKWFVKQVWPSIMEKYPDCIFHIAGRNAPLSLSKLLRTTNGIHFHGEIDNTDIFFSLSNIQAVPLFSGSGIRVKIIEAMQLGKIVIASSKAIEGIPAISGTHYLLANTAQEYMDALRLIFSEEIVATSLSSNAQSLIKENFNILAITADLIDFYKELNNV